MHHSQSDLREALMGLLAFTGQFTPRQYAQAMLASNPWMDMMEEDIAARFDEAQAFAWRMIAQPSTPTDVTPA